MQTTSQFLYFSVYREQFCSNLTYSYISQKWHRYQVSRLKYFINYQYQDHKERVVSSRPITFQLLTKLALKNYNNFAKFIE
jgi:hypothetical protein